VGGRGGVAGGVECRALLGVRGRWPVQQLGSATKVTTTARSVLRRASVAVSESAHAARGWTLRLAAGRCRSRDDE